MQIRAQKKNTSRHILDGPRFREGRRYLSPALVTPSVLSTSLPFNKAVIDLVNVGQGVPPVSQSKDELILRSTFLTGALAPSIAQIGLINRLAAAAVAAVLTRYRRIFYLIIHFNNIL